MPAEGTWPDPSARPVDATWTGGRTMGRLDPSRVLQSCQERSGRRVPPRAGDPVDLAALIFEPNGEAGPVAELTFRKPTADATVEVRGLLRLSEDVPRIEVALTWTVERGELLAHAADLPPGWTPDRVLSASGQPVAWHGDALSNGGTRVHIGPASADEDARSLTLTLAASARQAGVTGPLDLPRVRPATGARIVDEVWVATPDPNLRLSARSSAEGASPGSTRPTRRSTTCRRPGSPTTSGAPWPGAGCPTTPRPGSTGPRPTTRPRARSGSTHRSRRGRLRLEWTLAVDSPRGDLRSIPIHLDGPLSVPIRWRSREVGGPIVEARPIGAARRAALGFPSAGSAFELEMPGPSRGRIELRGQIERPWTGPGPSSPS